MNLTVSGKHFYAKLLPYIESFIYDSMQFILRLVGRLSDFLMAQGSRKDILRLTGSFQGNEVFNAKIKIIKFILYFTEHV